MLSTEALPFWTAVAAVAAAGSAVFAALYTFLTFRLVQMQDQAKVIAFVRHDPDRRTILCIRVENIGRDIARDVQFRPSRPIPSRAFGMDADTAEDAKPMVEGPLVEGIPALGPGDIREISWGQFGGLTKALGREPIVLDYSYRSGKRRLKGTTTLEVRSYWDTDASEKPAATAANALKQIAKSMESTDKAVVQIARKLNESE